MSVFDGLPDIFAETFGEAVEYTPKSSGVSGVITAIWWQTALEVPLDPSIEADALRTELSVRAAEIAEPQEGDMAKRLSDGLTMMVTTPIRPDGKGMIVVNLARTD